MFSLIFALCLRSFQPVIQEYDNLDPCPDSTNLNECQLVNVERNNTYTISGTVFISGCTFTDITGSSPLFDIGGNVKLHIKETEILNTESVIVSSYGQTGSDLIFEGCLIKDVSSYIVSADGGGRNFNSTDTEFNGIHHIMVLVYFISCATWNQLQLLFKILL